MRSVRVEAHHRRYPRSTTTKARRYVVYLKGLGFLTGEGVTPHLHKAERFWPDEAEEICSGLPMATAWRPV